MSSPFFDKVNKLAQRIRKRAKEEPQKNFSHICQESLQEAECYKLFSPEVFSKLQLESLPIFLPAFHVPNAFSDLTFTLYKDDIFHIDIYLWSKVDTVIHDHHVSGAFQCLHGESEQYNYHFKESREIHPQFSEGQLELTDSHAITPGLVQIIENGPRFIHNIIHKPPVVMTLFVRSHSERKNEKRFLRNYYYPGYSHEFDQPLRSQWLNTYLYHEVMIREKKVSFTAWKDSLKNLSDVDLTNLCLVLSTRDRNKSFTIETEQILKAETTKRWNIDWPHLIEKNYKILMKMRALNVN